MEIWIIEVLLYLCKDYIKGSVKTVNQLDEITIA